jgi:hypothetical protein
MLFRHRACRPAIGPGHEQATDDQVSERVGHATSAARGRWPGRWASVRLLPGHAAVGYVSPLAARITIDGDVPGGTDASLTRLLPRVADRLLRA